MDQKLIDKLKKRIEEGTLRSLSCFEGMIDFHSNDYLGLASFGTVRITKGTGSTGSRLISGTSKEALDCEKRLEDHFNAGGALFFNSGYDANLGFFSSLPQRNDIIIYDEDIHASVRDGIRLSLAKSYSFKHNDLEDLKRLISSVNGTIYVAVESLYSMRGDLAPLKEIAEICAADQIYLVVDEAHSFGIYGENGKGIVNELGLQKFVFARLITFGKAYGSHGAAVIGSDQLKTYLYNFSRSFIYTTALPGDSYSRVDQLISSVDLSVRREALKRNISLFRSVFRDLKIESDLSSPIQMIQIADRDKLNAIVREARDNGIALKAVYSPTVKAENEGVRISLHSFNTETEIHLLSNLFNKR